MRVYGVVNSSTEDAPLIKREKQTKFATASKIALLTVGLAGGVIAIASGSSSMRVFGLGTSSALAEKCGDLSAIPQCPSAKLGSSEAEKLLDSVQCATSKAQVKMYATGPCAAWPEGHAAQTMSVSKVGRKEMSSKKPSSGSVSGAMNDKTVVADTQKFNQNLQDSVDEAAQQAEAAAGNVTDVVQDGFQQVNNTWNEITGQGGEDDDEGDDDEEDSTPSEDEDSGDSEVPAPSEDEDSGDSEVPAPSEDEDSGNSGDDDAPDCHHDGIPKSCPPKEEEEDTTAATFEHIDEYTAHVDKAIEHFSEKVEDSQEEITEGLDQIDEANKDIDDEVHDVIDTTVHPTNEDVAETEQAAEEEDDDDEDDEDEEAKVGKKHHSSKTKSAVAANGEEEEEESEDEDSGDSEVPAPSEDEDSGDSEVPAPSETESVAQAEAESASAEEEAEKEVEDAVNHVEGKLTRMAEKIDAAQDEIDKSMTDIEKAQDAIDDAIDDEDDESHIPIHPNSTNEEQPPPSEEQDTSAYGTTSEATV